VLIDPVGAKALAFAPLLKAASMPRVGEAIASLIRSEGPGWRMVSYFFDRESVQHFRPRYAEQMKYRGFRRALLSTIRNHMLDSFLDEYEQVGKMEKPVLLLWGRHDTTVPLSHSSILRHAMPSAQFHICEECGHIPHYEKPEEVNPILLEFLRRQP
jgi:pimeloyl-ACP methyl ester carboxylesterase